MKSKSSIFYLLITLTFITLISNTFVNQASEPIFVPPTPSSFPTNLTADPHNETDLKQFFDDLLEEQMLDLNLPGISLSVVNATDILYLKGYGYANIEESKLVSPNYTLFRVASVSKLFTWTAVMQLHEQGLLELDEDINNYLTTFKIPITYGPITMLDLMSHSPGFEDYFFYKGPTKDDVLSLEEYLIEYMPKCVRLPGEVSAYSNYGASLAGYIVEEITGKSFAKYVEEEIFISLGMNHSTFLNALPAGWEEDLVTEYGIDNNDNLYPDKFDDYMKQYSPDGSLKSTALDISYFMRAHLNNGSFNSNNILSALTLQEMHTQHFSHHPQLDGFAHGFFELNLNGRRILMHGGSVSNTRSALILIPEEKLGFFISYNAYHVDPKFDVIYPFMDHFFPSEPVSSLEPNPDFKQTGKKYVGNYRYTRGPYNTPAVINYLIEFKHVSIDREGYLIAFRLKFVLIEDLLFRAANYDLYLAFKEDAQGKITYMCIGDVPANALEKQTGADNPLVAWSIVIVIILILLTTLLFIPIQRKIKKEEKYLPKTTIERLAQFSLQTTGWGFIGFIVIYGAFSSLLLVSEGILPLTRALLIIPYILVLSLLVLIGMTSLLWIKELGTLNMRVIATTMVTISIVLVWWMVHWRLIGYFYK